MKLPAPNITSQLPQNSFPPNTTEKRIPRNTQRHFLGHHAVSTYKPSRFRYLFCGRNSLTGKLMFLVILMLIGSLSICILDLPIVMDEVMGIQASEYILRACTGWIAKVARKERCGLNPTYLIIAPVPFLERTGYNTRNTREF